MADKTQNVKTRLSFDGEAEYKAACKEMILSILVDTFISKISLTMQPGPKIDSISGA